MNSTYQIYLISDSTGETLDRIFFAIKAQFKNIDYKIHTYSFTRTENQILKILYICLILLIKTTFYNTNLKMLKLFNMIKLIKSY